MKTKIFFVLACLGGLAACGPQTPEQRAATEQNIECAGATAVGTLAGAALGNQFGGGSGRTVATVAGGATGGVLAAGYAC